MVLKEIEAMQRNAKLYTYNTFEFSLENYFVTSREGNLTLW